MYVIGIASDFSSRLLQGVQTANDLNSFRLEGLSYLNLGGPDQIKGQWNKLFAKASSSAIRNNIYFIVPPFTIGNQLTYLLDLNGDLVLDVNGNPIILI